MNNKSIQLIFRSSDRDIFNAIKTGKKKIETRAATERFIKIKPGDFLKMVCGKDKFEKRVSKVKRFKTISEMLKIYKVKDINSFLNSTEELKKMYYSFPGYKDKIKKHGLIALELE